MGKSAFHAFTARAISTVSRIIGPVTSEIPRQSASFTSSSTRLLKFGVIVVSMSFTEKPCRSRGVATARIPSGAVASLLAKEGKKKTTFLDIVYVSSQLPGKRYGRVRAHLSRRCQTTVTSSSQAIYVLDFALEWSTS